MAHPINASRLSFDVHLLNFKPYEFAKNIPSPLCTLFSNVYPIQEICFFPIWFVHDRPFQIPSLDLADFSCCNLLVRKSLVGLLLFVSLISSLTQAGNSAFPKYSVAIEISHSHEHEHGDHGHSHEAVDASDEDAADVSDHDEASGDVPSNTHKHTILITTSISVALTENIAIHYIENANTLPIDLSELDPPADRTLASIFRPPIRA